MKKGKNCEIKKFLAQEKVKNAGKDAFFIKAYFKEEENDLGVSLNI